MSLARLHAACLVGFGLLRSAGFLSAAEVALSGPEEEPIRLPEFTVTAERELPPPESWRYARLPGIEILSNAPDAATQQIVRDFRLFDAAMRVVWPVLERSRVNLTLILCGTGGKFDDFAQGTAVAAGRGSPSLCLHDAGHADIVLDLQTRILNLLTEEQLLVAPDSGEDPGSAADPFPGFAVDHYRQLKREYIRLLLSGVEPRAPAWLEEGLAQIFTTMQIERRSIIFGRIADPNLLTPEEQTNAINAATADPEIGATRISAPAEDEDFNKTLARRGLIPLDDFLAVTRDSAKAQNVIGSTWAKQAQAFVHLCLYGRGGRYRDGFIRFVGRLAHEPLSETLFQECFGRGYRAMETELRGYIEFTDHQYQEFRAKGSGLPEMERLELREATPDEIGRIKGDALVRAGNVPAARLTLLAAYLRGERPPALLASFGLAEAQGGDPQRARQLLEAAFAAGAVRPEAHLALARLRLAEFTEQPVRPDRKLPPEQAASVLRPLFLARTQYPPLAGVYDLIAEVWERGLAVPTRENLAVLDEGIVRFPRHAELVLRAARLNARHGFLDEARTLIDVGLKAAPEPALREKFVALQRTLP